MKDWELSTQNSIGIVDISFFIFSLLQMAPFFSVFLIFFLFFVSNKRAAIFRKYVAVTSCRSFSPSHLISYLNGI